MDMVEKVEAKDISSYIQSTLLYSVLLPNVHKLFMLLADWKGSNLFMERTVLHGLRWVCFKVRNKDFMLDLYANTLNCYTPFEKNHITFAEETDQFYLARLIWREIHGKA